MLGVYPPQTRPHLPPLHLHATPSLPPSRLPAHACPNLPPLPDLPYSASGRACLAVHCSLPKLNPLCKTSCPTLFRHAFTPPYACHQMHCLLPSSCYLSTIFTHLPYLLGLVTVNLGQAGRHTIRDVGQSRTTNKQCRGERRVTSDHASKSASHDTRSEVWPKPGRHIHTTTAVLVDHLSPGHTAVVVLCDQETRWLTGTMEVPWCTRRAREGAPYSRCHPARASWMPHNPLPSLLAL